MSDLTRRLLSLAGWLSACVALLPTAAAVLVATVQDDLTRWALFGLPVLALGVLVLFVLGRGRVALALLPMAMVLYAAGLPESVRAGLHAPGGALVSIGGVLVMTVAVVLLERPVANEVGEPLPLRAKTPMLEQVRELVAVAAIGVPGTVVLVMPSVDPSQELLAFAAVAFLWSMAYYSYFAIPSLNREFELARLTAAGREAGRRRRTLWRAWAGVVVAAASVVGAAALGSAP